MRLILIFLLGVLQVSATSQPLHFSNNARIYLVRHAEKGPGEDPSLTTDGHKRAGALLRTLKNKKVRRIDVTEFKRTQQTGDSLRIQLGIDTVHYWADTSGKTLLAGIKAHNDTGKTILVIGHSNTVPVLIRKLGITRYPKDPIPDNEFNNLYLLTFRNGRASLKKTKYGVSTGASEAMRP